MGNEESSPIDPSTDPMTLSSRTLSAVADYILSDSPKSIVVMTGAGISTSAGIPDFRSPETGLYANLARLDLPYAEAVFDISYFRERPEAFYTLAHDLYPGRYRPTITHSFIRLLHEKGLLLKHFTQNIDCLDREAGVPGDKIVEAHGSFAEQGCIDCREPYPSEEIKAHVEAKTIPRCERCGGLVKPGIVFFGEQLPASFFENRMLPFQADLCLVLGTSLTVQPFASLPSLVREEVPRVLFNSEAVGGLGSRADDVLVLGDCDEGVRRLAKECGWLEELEALWAETAPKVEGVGKRGKEGGEGTVKEKSLEEQIEHLTKEVDQTLRLSKSHEAKVRKEVDEPSSSSSAAKAASSTTETAPRPHEDHNGNLDHVFLTGPRTEAAGSTSKKKDEKDDDTK